MRGLTLTPPWGTLIAVAALRPALGKHIETRSWALPSAAIGIPMAIHQAQGLPRSFSEADLAALCASWPFAEALAAVGITKAAQLPRGRIVAVVTPIDCVPTQNSAVAVAPGQPWFVGHRSGVGQHYYEVPPPEPERSFGNYAPGRYAWLLDDIAALAEPVPCRGSLSLWRVPAEVEAQIRAQLGAGESKKPKAES
jgi:hypothetical protein